MGPSAPRPQSEQHKEAVRGGRRWRGETGRAHVTEGTHRERTGWERQPARQALMEMKQPPGSTRKRLHQPGAWSLLRIYIVF